MRTLDQPAVEGSVQAGFEPVRRTFVENFTNRDELGAAVCIYLHGEKVVIRIFDPDTLVQDGVVPENLRNSVLTNDDLGPDSLQYGTLSSAGQQLWQDGYSDFLAGGGS